jgi:hypothetical protein
LKRWLLTKAERRGEELFAEAAEHQSAGVVNTVHRPVTKLEDSDDIVGPCRDDGNKNQANDARDHAQNVEGGGD